MPGDDGYYASLSTPDRWKWHAHHYAFRRVYLDVPESEHTSPADTKGEWYSEDMVAAETRRLLIVKAKQTGLAARHAQSDRDPRNDPIVQAQRKAWVTYRGYLSWDHYLDAVEAGREKISAFLAWCDDKHPHPNRVGSFQRVVPPAAAE